MTDTSASTLQDRRRLSLLRAMGVLTAPAEPALLRTCRVAAWLLRAPLTALVIPYERRGHLVAHFGAAEAEPPALETMLIAPHVPFTQPLVIPAGAGIAASDDPTCLPQGSYLAIPLFSAEGIWLGALTAARIDPWATEELRLTDDLRTMAEETLHRLENASQPPQVASLEPLLTGTPLVLTLWEVAERGRLRWMSGNAQELLGYDAARLMAQGTTLDQLIHPDDYNRLTQQAADAPGEDRMLSLRYRLRLADGSYRWMNDLCRLLPGEEGGRVRMETHCWWDAQEQHEAQQELYRANQRLRSIVEMDTAYIVRTDVEGRYTFVNERYRELMRRAYGSDEAMLGMNSIEAVVPQDHSILQDAIERCLRQPGQSVQVMLRQPNPLSDRLCHILWDVVGVPDENGDVVEIQSVGFDVTALIDAQQLLAQREQLYRFVFENTNDAIILHNAAGRILLANDPPAFRLGYDPLDIASRDAAGLAALIHPDDLPSLDQERAARAQQKERESFVTYRLRRQDGSYMWVENRTHYVYDEQGEITYYITIHRDISEQMAASEALRRSEERYRNVTRMMCDFVFETRFDQEGEAHLAWLEDRFSVTGFTSLTTSLTQWKRTVVHPDDREQVQRDIQATRQGESTVSEYRIRRSSGQLVWLRTVRLPIFDKATGSVTGYYGVAQDITAQRLTDEIRQERDRLVANLRNEQTLSETLRRVVSAVSHDMRTPLAVIATSRDLLERYSDRMSAERRQAALQTIGKQVAYVNSMIETMMLHIRGTIVSAEPALRPVNLEQLCAVTVSELQQTIGAQHVMTFAVAWDRGLVLLDETLISRMLFNLLSNAVKFSPPGSHVELELTARDDAIVLRVRDGGIGIPADEQSKVFDLFYRASNSQAVEGTGLGLSIVHECVQRHNGHLTLESEVNKGTTITVVLPLRPAPASPDV